jgi:hypothetical protein
MGSMTIADASAIWYMTAQAEALSEFIPKTIEEELAAMERAGKDPTIQA